MVEASQQALLELLELQKVDSTIDLWTTRLNNLPEQAALEELQQRQRDLEAQVGECESSVDNAAGRQAKLEHEVGNIGLKIAGEERRMNSGDIGSPRELGAIVAEIEALKRRRVRFEDDQLEVMEELEELEGRLGELKEALAATTQRVQEALGQRDAAASQVRQELDQARAGRQELAPRIEAGLLRYYENLRASKGGVGAAALQGSMCLGCHMQLPAQEVARIRASEGLVRCDECGRILVVTDRRSPAKS